MMLWQLLGIHEAFYSNLFCLQLKSVMVPKASIMLKSFVTANVYVIVPDFDVNKIEDLTFWPVKNSSIIAFRFSKYLIDPYPWSPS